MKKVSLPVAIVIGCILIALGLGAAFLVKKDNFKLQDKSEETVRRTDYTDVARKTLDWIDSQRNEEGWYILERGCDYETKTCDIVWDNEEGNKDGLIATWARLNFYEQHQDPKDLEIVKKDINIFYDKYKDDNLKDSLWICKITYEMAQSKHLDQTQKDKLKELCFNVKFPLPRRIENYWLVSKNEKLSKLSDNKWKEWSSYEATLRGFDASLGYPTDLIYRYKWFKNESDLELAQNIFKVINQLYLDNEKDNFLDQVIKNQEDICLTVLSSIDIYNLNKDDKVLSFVNNIYEKTLTKLENIASFQTSICGEVAKSLFRLTSNKKYLSDLERNNRVIVTLGRDGNNSVILNDGGFFKSNGVHSGVSYKSVAENGFLVELIRN